MYIHAYIAEKIQKEGIAMTTVTLGSTGITVNKNGFGALPVQRISKEEGAALLRKAYEGTGATTTDIDYTKINETMEKAKKISFKDAFIRYTELNSNKFQLGIDSELEYLVNAQPLIVDAFNKLGTDRVKKLRYIKKDIEKALCATEDTKNLDTKIAKILYSSLQLGFNSSASIKNSIKEAYELVGVTDKAKATDIVKWFNADEKMIRLDGKPTKGYILNSKKYIFG